MTNWKEKSSILIFYKQLCGTNNTKYISLGPNRTVDVVMIIEKHSTWCFLCTNTVLANNSD